MLYQVPAGSPATSADLASGMIIRSACIKSEGFCPICVWRLYLKTPDGAEEPAAAEAVANEYTMKCAKKYVVRNCTPVAPKSINLKIISADR